MSKKPSKSSSASPASPEGAPVFSPGLPQARRQGSPRTGDSAPTDHNIPESLPATDLQQAGDHAFTESIQHSSSMQAGNRELIASKLGCPPEDFLVYREFDRMDDPLCRVIVAILPDGRKFKFTVACLHAAHELCDFSRQAPGTSPALPASAGWHVAQLL